MIIVAPVNMLLLLFKATESKIKLESENKIEHLSRLLSFRPRIYLSSDCKNYRSPEVMGSGGSLNQR